MNKQEKTSPAGAPRRPAPDAVGERTPAGDGLLRLHPRALAALLQRKVHLRPGGFVAVYFNAATGALGVRLDRDGEFRLRGRLDQGLWTRSPLLTRERFREGPYRLAFPPGVDFALEPVTEESGAAEDRPRARRVSRAPRPGPPGNPARSDRNGTTNHTNHTKRIRDANSCLEDNELTSRVLPPSPAGVDGLSVSPDPMRGRRRSAAHAVLSIPRASAPQLRTTAAGTDFLAENKVALSPGDRVALRFDPATGRLDLRRDPAGPFRLRAVPGTGPGFSLAATALARLVGRPERYVFSLSPSGNLLLSSLSPPPSSESVSESVSVSQSVSQSIAVS